MADLSQIKTASDSVSAMSNLRSRFVRDIRAINAKRKKRGAEVLSEKEVQEFADSRMRKSLRSKDRQGRLGERLEQVREKKKRPSGRQARFERGTGTPQKSKPKTPTEVHSSYVPGLPVSAGDRPFSTVRDQGALIYPLGAIFDKKKRADAEFRAAAKKGKGRDKSKPTSRKKK